MGGKNGREREAIASSTCVKDMQETEKQKKKIDGGKLIMKLTGS